MKMNGNTILITGGGSGIGRALAEAFHALGNQVIITGRRQSALAEVTAANPGMQAMALDMTDAEGIKAFAAEIVKTYPSLNAVLNNAGIMVMEEIGAGGDYLEISETTIATNLLGPIRLGAALLPHLRTGKDAAMLNVSSGLAFVPMAMTPTYSATKAAIHSYTMGLRHQLKDTGTQVIEIVPPYVQTELMGAHQASDPNAMPLADFISEVMQILTDQPDVTEVVVERCKPLRYAAENGNLDAMFNGINAIRH
ncbi:SDR family oxidoreductase [Rhizobium sp. XQZ8]|uniref:SDR family oxidoreductase n=1 Tax=Rhizobium populisoli TaxID=2859785 RepID=UPI001C671775|nr:SDR family oxidoreductase [Rhizobium populisoli]MBW6421128.1 SDR family oxidoreductase [Rhizobium populisoli]